MGSARDFHLPPHLAAINRFTSDGVRIALRLKIALESKHSGVAFDSTDIPVCARRAPAAIPGRLFARGGDGPSAH